MRRLLLTPYLRLRKIATSKAGLGGDTPKSGLERRLSTMPKITLTIRFTDGTTVEITVEPPPS
jgi:hypothetical protein